MRGLITRTPTLPQSVATQPTRRGVPIPMTPGGRPQPALRRSAGPAPKDAEAARRARLLVVAPDGTTTRQAAPPTLPPASLSLLLLLEARRRGVRPAAAAPRARPPTTPRVP